MLLSSSSLSSSSDQVTSCLHCWKTCRMLRYGLLDDDDDDDEGCCCCCGEAVAARWRLLLDGRDSGLRAASTASASRSACSAASFRSASMNDSFTNPSIVSGQNSGMGHATGPASSGGSGSASTSSPPTSTSSSAAAAAASPLASPRLNPRRLPAPNAPPFAAAPDHGARPRLRRRHCPRRGGSPPPPREGWGVVQCRRLHRSGSAAQREGEQKPSYKMCNAKCK